MSEISELIRRMSAMNQIEGLRLATVKKVDEQKRLCEVMLVEDESELIDVYLQANDSLTVGVCLLPKIDSWVIVQVMEQSRGVVMVTSEIEKIIIDCDTITINGGANKGIVKVEAMVCWMEKVHQDLTALISLLSTSTVAGNGAPLGIVFSPKTPLPSVAEFANDNIKH